jgi:hypothetical protein
VTWIRNRALGLVHHDKAQSFGGYTLFSPVRGRHADLLDAGGQIVHQWHHPEGVQHLKLLPNGHLLIQAAPPEFAEGAETIGGCAAAMFELDQASNVVWEYRDPYMHHDYQRLDNGNTLLARWAKMPADVSARVQGGFAAADDPEWMWGDEIREIDSAGETVRAWRSWEHLSPDHHVKCPLESRKEWTHLNSLELTPTGDWLVSFRLTSTMVIVDGTTGDVRWRWGAGELSHQHHATWMDDGTVMVFDNGCHRREAPSYSRILQVDRKTKEIRWTFKQEPILGFYSFMVSGAERLPNGNTLVTEGASGRLFEVTAEGEVVWEYVSPWMVETPYGKSPAVFRSYRIAEGDPRLDGLALDPTPYESLNQRIAACEELGADDEPGAPRKKRAARRPARAAAATPARRRTTGGTKAAR